MIIIQLTTMWSLNAVGIAFCRNFRTSVFFTTGSCVIGLQQMEQPGTLPSSLTSHPGISRLHKGTDCPAFGAACLQTGAGPVSSPKVKAITQFNAFVSCLVTVAEADSPSSLEVRASHKLPFDVWAPLIRRQLPAKSVE